MITKKQWKEFNEYRDKLYKEAISSEQYKKLKEEQTEALSLHFTVKERRYRWSDEIIERTYTKSIGTLYADIFLMEILAMQEAMLFSKIPERTVEACLDWLNKKDV